MTINTTDHVEADGMGFPMAATQLGYSILPTIKMTNKDRSHITISDERLGLGKADRGGGGRWN